MSADREGLAALVEQGRRRAAAQNTRTDRILDALVSRRAVSAYVVAFCAGAVAFLLIGASASVETEGRLRQANAPAAPLLARGSAGASDGRSEVVIHAELAGLRLTHVLVDVGSTVVRGELLARGDDTELRAQLARQDRRIRRIEAELVQRIAEAGDLARAARSGAALELQSQQAAIAAARAEARTAHALRHEVELKLARTRIVAPAAGVISKKSAVVGDVLPHGAELFRLTRATHGGA